MKYRIVQTQAQRFLAIVGHFNNNITNEDGNHDIPDFWAMCGAKGLIERLLILRPSGKQDLYGLCSPAKAGEDFFSYGIGILVDEETLSFNEEEMAQEGYSIWDVKPGTYAVFDCMGEDTQCIGETWSQFHQEFLSQTGYIGATETDYETYFENGKSGLFCELWIPVQKK